MLTFITLMHPAWSLAQSCHGVGDGEVVRLDAPGKPLHNFRTQDQDGLGTCYANTASVLLQSKLKNNPEVSYLNLAFMYAEKHSAPAVRQNGQDSGFQPKKNPTDSDAFLIDGGFTCETIMAAKERGGVCKRSDVALESFFHSDGTTVAADSSWIQKDLINKLSRYYDGIFHSFERKQNKPENQLPGILSFLAPKQKEEPNRFQEYKLALKNVLNKGREKYSEATCLKPDTAQSEEVLKNILARIYQYSNNPKNFKNKDFKRIMETGRKFGSTYKMKTSQGYKLEIDIQPQAKKALKDVYLKTITETPEANAEETFLKTLSKIHPSFNEKMLKAIGGLSDQDKVHLAIDEDRYVRKNIEECKKAQKLEYFTSDDGFMKDFNSDTCLAKYSNHAENIRQLVTTLDKANMRNIDSLYSFLMDLPEMNYEQAMMRMVGPDCPDDKKIKLPEDLQCEGKDITYPYGEQTAATDAAFLQETKTRLKNVAADAFKSGNAVGLSICTGFWDPLNPDQFYNKTKQCPTTTHGFHAVAMVGYRCKAGQMQYLIQNSWGDWAAANTRFAETEPGKAWISEEDLAKNAYRYDVIK